MSLWVSSFTPPPSSPTCFSWILGWPLAQHNLPCAHWHLKRPKPQVNGPVETWSGHPSRIQFPTTTANLTFNLPKPTSLWVSTKAHKSHHIYVVSNTISFPRSRRSWWTHVHDVNIISIMSQQLGSVQMNRHRMMPHRTGSGTQNRPSASKHAWV